MTLANKQPDYLNTGTSKYVPAMAYASDIVLGQVSPFSLGTPAAASATALDTDIDADATAGTVTTQSWVADSPYGRTLTMSMDGNPGANAVYDVYGKDYLGQPMVERFTHVNGATTVIYGKKAFYTVSKVVVVTAAANATTVNLGTGYRLGKPYKAGYSAWIKEGGVFVPSYAPLVTLKTTLAAADAAAGGSRFLKSPVPGYIQTLRGIPHGGGSTNDPVVTVELGGTAVTGLTVTVDTSNAAGLNVTDTPTTTGYNANNRLIAGDMIEIVSAAAASAGAIDVEIDIVNNQHVAPDTTDAATVSTGDPRGTFESLAVFDGSTEFIIGLVAENEVNASGNGGLHGIQHYYA